MKDTSIFKGITRKLVPDGYERLLEIIHSNSGKTYWFSVFEPDHYIDPDTSSGHYQVGQEISFQPALKLVNSVQVLNGDSMLEIHQPISESPHAELVGRITQVLGSDSFVCDAGNDFPSIIVELEHPQPLFIDQVVQASGELSNRA